MDGEKERQYLAQLHIVRVYSPKVLVDATVVYGIHVLGGLHGDRVYVMVTPRQSGTIPLTACRPSPRHTIIGRFLVRHVGLYLRVVGSAVPVLYSAFVEAEDPTTMLVDAMASIHTCFLWSRDDWGRVIELRCTQLVRARQWSAVQRPASGCYGAAGTIAVLCAELVVFPKAMSSMLTTTTDSVASGLHAPAWIGKQG